MHIDGQTNILILGFLVLIFGSIVRRCTIGQLQFWFLGWVLVLVHFLSKYLDPEAGAFHHAAVSADYSALALAGISFLVAVSTVCSDERKRKLLVAALGIPVLVYTNAVVWQWFSKPAFLAVVVATMICVMALIWSYYRKLNVYVIAVMAGCVTVTAVLCRSIARAEYVQTIQLIQAALFTFCGVLYARRFRRGSVGVITASAAFLVWGFSVASRTMADAPTITADFPTYLVALGMILTVLEDQIQESKLASEKLVHQARDDVLTGLPNRVLLEDRLGQSLMRAKRANTHVAVLCIDLDRFKQVNDTFGHHVGDLYLQGVVSRFSARLREVDTLARTGGDEFMAVLSDLHDLADAKLVARDLLQTLDAPISVDGYMLQASASIGIALYPDDAEQEEMLRRAADQAMYRAKTRGRNHFECFSEEARDVLDIESHLRHALTQGGFDLYYQPQFRIDGAVVGMEALLRFRHPRLGLVPPSRFIPIAEESGLIVPIGDWVLREVCVQTMAWEKQFNMPLRVAVNVSALQFGRADFADTVAKILNETGIDPAMIELELTETLVMANVEESARQMMKLKNLGIHLSVDDFGTGYSSLSYLHQLPIDTLKIDRSFVEKVTEPGGTRPIVEAIIALARSLDMRTIAEGVETDDQFKSVCQLGCDVIQGFLFSKPIKGSSVAEFLQRAKRTTDLQDVKSLPVTTAEVARANRGQLPRL